MIFKERKDMMLKNVVLIGAVGVCLSSFGLGLVPEDPARDWKCVYSSAEGPEGRALAVLTEKVSALTLRNGDLRTSHVFPLERVGGKEVAKKHRFVLGVPGKNPFVDKYLKPGEVPKGGYVVKSLNDGDAKVVVLAGDSPAAVLWATLDFCRSDIREIAWWGRTAEEHVGWFVTERMLFTVPKLPDYLRVAKPETEIRSQFTWGHVIDDYRRHFRTLAELRFNRVILWNEFPPVNAAEIVKEAHDWGLQVYWGFAWGWTADLCQSAETADLKALADGIVKEWRELWKSCDGDGIYFQTFTEQSNTMIGNRTIASMAVEVVNDAYRRIRAEAPDLDIVFGLHAMSVRTNLPEIEKADRSMEILWENCGGFPFYENTNATDIAFLDRICGDRRPVGLVWKCQVRQDWENWAHQSGPFLLGEAGKETDRRDEKVYGSLYYTFDDDWLARGRIAYDQLRHLRTGANPPKEMNVAAALFAPPSLSTHLIAELFWSTSDPWEKIVERAQRAHNAALVR